jgi:NAD+ diphosphatase
MPNILFEYHPTLSPPSADSGALTVYFLQDKLLLKELASDPWTDTVPDAPLSHSLGLGAVNGVPLRCAELTEMPATWTAIGLRDYLQLCDESIFRVVSTASQLVYWARSQNYCCRCGKLLRFVGNDRALVCEYCKHRVYPAVSPCVIVTVYRDGALLLARSHRMKKLGIYSCIAGFVEVGESIEEAVHREVLEEAGIKVANLRYVASQSWPFPHQLMLGFVAEYASGDLTIDTQEIDHAGWFTPDNLPPLPPPQTIASRLIRVCLDDYLR